MLNSKWINYSEQFLGQRFSTPKDITLVQSGYSCEKVSPHPDSNIQLTYMPFLDVNTEHVNQTYRDISPNLSHKTELQPLPNISTFNRINSSEKCSSSPTSSCSSPRDINEISLHISLINNCNMEDEGLISYSVISAHEDIFYSVISEEDNKI